MILNFPVTTLYVGLLHCVQLFATPWIIAHQDPLSLESSRQEYWSGLLFHSQGDLPIQGLNLGLLHWQADSLPQYHLWSNHIKKKKVKKNFISINNIFYLNKYVFQHVIKILN